jgi:anti-anti-sigma factor
LASINTAEVASDAYVVSVAGPLGDDAALTLRGALFPVAAADGALVLLDLTASPFVERASLGVIASAAHMSRRRGEELVIVTRDPRMKSVFHDCGLDDIVRVERSIAEGIAHAV